jgi:hypothetical protein
VNVAGTCERRPEWTLRSVEPDHNLSNLMGEIRRRDGKTHTFVWVNRHVTRARRARKFARKPGRGP